MRPILAAFAVLTLTTKAETVAIGADQMGEVAVKDGQ
ncbi:hypothetical protein BH09PSE3_BH09PSE3_03440 [soil metagenome]